MNIKNFYIVLFSIIIVTASLFFISNTVNVKKYTASTQLLETVPKMSATLGELNFNILLLETYVDIAKGDALIKEAYSVLKEKGYSIDSEKTLRDQIEVENSYQSQMLTLKITAPDREYSVTAAKIIAELFQKFIQSNILGSNIKIISQAEIVQETNSFEKSSVVIIGIISGMFVGLSIIRLLHWLNPTLKSEHFIVSKLELPVIGRLE